MANLHSLFLAYQIACFGVFSGHQVKATEYPKAEHSLVVKNTIAHSDPLLPESDAEVWVWSDYVADKWNGYDSEGTYTETFKTRRACDGSPIDIVSYKYQLISKCVLIPRKMIWEVRRAYDWQRAIGRAARLKGLTDTKDVGIVLIVENFNYNHPDILNAKIACEAVGFYLKTVDKEGTIR